MPRGWSVTSWLAASLEALQSEVPPGEQILAVGLAVGHPVVVTSVGILRWGGEGAVRIPFDAVLRCESWTQAHRWSVRLVHREVDPRWPPSDARQWWRWHDRRAHHRRGEIARFVTILHFSRKDTEAARAIRTELSRRGIDCHPGGPPPPEPPNFWARVGMIVIEPMERLRWRSARRRHLRRLTRR